MVCSRARVDARQQKPAVRRSLTGAARFASLRQAGKHPAAHTQRSKSFSTQGNFPLVLRSQRGHGAHLQRLVRADLGRAVGERVVGAVNGPICSYTVWVRRRSLMASKGYIVQFRKLR